MNITVYQAAEFLKEHDNFTVLCHINPDGDTLGSAYALCGALRLMGKKARVLCPDVPSPRFDYLKKCADFSDFSDIPASDETVVTADIADSSLLGETFGKTYGLRINLCIDHHLHNKLNAEHKIVDENSAACAEIIWEIIRETGITPTDEIAAAIYTGISTDTGCFKYANTTAKSHIITAELMSYDFDIAGINYVMFDMKTRVRAELEQAALNGMEYYFDGRCALVTLTKGMTDGVDIEDVGIISALPRQIEDVDIGAVLKEKERGENGSVWKISLRASPNADVQKICSAFGGGGHIRAAGCTLTGDLQTVKEILIGEIGKQLTVNSE